MKSLSYYLLESYNLSTIQQEMLTCIFFDMYFNRGIKKEDIFSNLTEDLLLYAGNLITLEQVNDIDKKWRASFEYQIDSMENFLKTNQMKGELIFIHHDTSIGILNGKVLFNCNICQRVNNGVNKYGITSYKDDYQKADIYAQVSTFEVDNTPLDTIKEELDWWISNKEQVVGISLKKLINVVKHPHFYNIDTTLSEGKISEIFIKFDPFTAKKNSITGNVSAEIDFFLGWGGNTLGKMINFRSNTGIHLEKPRTYWSPVFAIELSSKKFNKKTLLTKKLEYQDIDNPAIDAQEGKLKAQFDRVVSQSAFKNSTNNKIYTANELYDMAKDMQNLVDKFSNKIQMTSFSKPSKELQEATERVNTLNIINNIEDAKVIKWSKITEKQIEYISSILTLANGDEEHIKKILFNMILMAKGVNTDKNISDEADYTHLPYVMLG